MANQKLLGPSDRQALYKANSGGIRFKMRTAGQSPELIMISNREPVSCLYKLTFGYRAKIYNILDKQAEKFPSSSVTYFGEFRDYYLTWHNQKIQVGIDGQKPFVTYQKKCTDPIVGYILFIQKCRSLHPVEWIIETSPVILESIPLKILSERLHWRTMRNGKLPPDAMIGGFDNEHIYIARAAHYNSLCPGKYVPSIGKAFVPWGHLEHAKEEFEILCGINAKWVKTESNYIPQNAFIGGHSEVNNDPLYIGRAMIEGRLICGKVHLLYKMCYLPFQGKEVEKPMYEILVIPGDEIPQAYEPIVLSHTGGFYQISGQNHDSES